MRGITAFVLVKSADGSETWTVVFKGYSRPVSVKQMDKALARLEQVKSYMADVANVEAKR